MSTLLNTHSMDFSKNLNLLYPIINKNDISSLKNAIQLCYEFYRIMDIRHKLIYNYHNQKSNNINIINEPYYKKFLLLNNNIYSRNNNEYDILSHAIYKCICSINPNNHPLLKNFHNMTKYNNHNFRKLLNTLNYSISLPLMNFSKKPFIDNSDKTLMKAWTIMLNKFILKIISTQNCYNKSLVTLQLHINNIINSSTYDCD